MPFGAVAGSVAAAAAGAAINSAMAPSSPNIPLSQPSSMGGAGGKSYFNVQTPVGLFKAGNGTYTVSPSGDIRSQLMDELRPNVDMANAGLSGLLGRVDPAFGDLVNSQVQSLQNAKQSSISDLQGSLARRRILGSSFGQDAVTRTSLDYDNQIRQAKAQGILESIDAQSKLLGQRLQNTQALIEQEVKNAEYSSSTMVNLINGTQQAFADNANVLGQLAAANAQGIGAASAGIGNAVGSLAQQGVNYLLSPSTPTDVSYGTNYGGYANYGAGGLDNTSAGNLI